MSPWRSAAPSQGLPPIQCVTCLVTWLRLRVDGRAGRRPGCPGPPWRRPRSASCGGAIRRAWPYRPPLPMSSPRSRVSSSIRVASAGLGAPVAGSTRSTREHQALAAYLADRAQRRGRLGQPSDDHAAEDGGVAPAGRGRAGSPGWRWPRWWQRVAAEGGDAVAAAGRRSGRRGRPRRRSRTRCRGPWRTSSCPGSTPCAPMPQKCSPVRPQPVCTSSEMNRMPCSSSTSA